MYNRPRAYNYRPTPSPRYGIVGNEHRTIDILWIRPTWWLTFWRAHIICCGPTTDNHPNKIYVYRNRLRIVFRLSCYLLCSLGNHNLYSRWFHPIVCILCFQLTTLAEAETPASTPLIHIQCIVPGHNNEILHLQLSTNLNAGRRPMRYSSTSWLLKGRASAFNKGSYSCRENVFPCPLPASQAQGYIGKILVSIRLYRAEHLPISSGGE